MAEISKLTSYLKPEGGEGVLELKVKLYTRSLINKAVDKNDVVGGYTPERNWDRLRAYQSYTLQRIDTRLLSRPFRGVLIYWRTM